MLSKLTMMNAIVDWLFDTVLGRVTIVIGVTTFLALVIKYPQVFAITVAIGLGGWVIYKVIGAIIGLLRWIFYGVQ